MILLLVLLLAAAPAALAVPVAVSVEGYIYTPDGTPIAKAAVTAGSQTATTSDDGHFKLTAPADSIVSIEVRAADLPPLKLLALAGDPPFTITLGTPTHEAMTATTMRRMTNAPAAARDRIITGVVRIGKKPLANAPVILHGNGEPIHVTSDEKGRYRANVAPGRYVAALGDGLAPRLRSIYDGRMRPESEMESADVTKAAEATMDIELVADPLITGRVLDADQKPVARADVIVVPAGRPALESFHQPITRTLPDGRFAVPAIPFHDGETDIVVTPVRHSPVRSKSTTITLPRFEKVTVRITGNEGKALPGATVGYAAADEIATFGDSSVLLMPHSARRQVKADANGQVVLHLEPGDYELAAAASKHQQRTVSRAIARASTIDVALEPGYQIRGRVHRGKQPVYGAGVTLRGGTAPRGERTVRTDGKGEFVFDALRRETYTIQISKWNEMLDKTMTVEAPADLDIDLPPVAMLRGRVLDARTGEPVPQFLYSLETVDAAPDQRPTRRGEQRGESTSDGTFAAYVPAGTYRIIANSHGFVASEPQEVRVSTEGQAFVEIRLSRGASVSGRVTDAEGAPVAEAQVMVMREIGEITRSSRTVERMGPSTAASAEDGTFAMTGVETGPAQLIVRRRGYVMHRRTIEVKPETRLDITLERGLTIAGMVTLHGKPVARANVDATTSAIGSDHQSAVTDEHGRFVLEGLVAARYTLRANFDSHSAQLTNVDASSQTVVTIELENQGRGTVFGTVTGLPRTAGKMVRGSVFAQATERGAEGAIDAAGNYRVENAPAGTLDVVAHMETSQGGVRWTTRKKVELTAGEALRVDLDLTPALTVTGRVTIGGSKPVARAQVVFNSEEGTGLTSATTRDDGTYEVGLPSPGRYQIFVHAEMLQTGNYQTIRQIGGSQAIDMNIAEQSIEGVVVDAATAQPIANALVTLVPRDARQGRLRVVSGETITDAAGHFTLRIAASGPHNLIASANGYAHRSQELHVGDGMPVVRRFELTGANEVRIRMIDARTATPLEAHLEIADERGNFLPVRPRRLSNGEEFAFSLARGKYRVKVISMGYAEKTVEVTAPGSIVIPME